MTLIEKIEFQRFRGFSKLKAVLNPHAYIVGPNSAGKSTILEAVALAETCLQRARRQKPTIRAFHNGLSRSAYSIPSSIEDEDDPVRFDFGVEEARVTVIWSNGARITIVWPTEVVDDDLNDPVQAFFYLEDGNGVQVRTPLQVKALFSLVFVVPVVTPLDRIEEIKSAQYVQSRIGTRLASRHFRNHAYLMSKDATWNEFINFCEIWIPEIQISDVRADYGINRLAVFYNEEGSRIPKELAWAGDGMQIWVQLLWHLYRAREARTIVLDEPDVYLHPNLQRRLVKLLNTFDAQVILASHSADIIAEAPPAGVLWVDRRQNRAVRAKSEASLNALSESLGTGYNIALARSMRARLIIATDVQDARIIRKLAELVGAIHIMNDRTVQIVQISHTNDSTKIADVSTAMKELLPKGVPVVFLIESGGRPAAVNSRIIEEISRVGGSVRIWKRMQIENYLLDPDAIAKVSGSASEIVEIKISESIASQRDIAESEYLSAAVRYSEARSPVATLDYALKEFENMWEDWDSKTDLISGRRTLADINSWLKQEGYSEVSPNSLVRTIRPQKLSEEIFQILLELDGFANS